MGGITAAPDLEPVEIHEVLSNERRQLILEFLSEANGPLSARDLSEKIAEAETDESPPPTNIRQSAYVSLHQTHLPKLDELEIVDYDQSAKTVELNDRAHRINEYRASSSTSKRSWNELYLTLSVLGLLAVAGGEAGTPVLAAIGSLTLASAAIVLIAAFAGYQTARDPSSILSRVVG
ncbi:MAG: ArsR family transcriptional regulator [Halobacteriales archaeon]